MALSIAAVREVVLEILKAIPNGKHAFPELQEDAVPAMHTPGEAVVNMHSTKLVPAAEPSGVLMMSTSPMPSQGHQYNSCVVFGSSLPWHSHMTSQGHYGQANWMTSGDMGAHQQYVSPPPKIEPVEFDQPLPTTRRAIQLGGDIPVLTGGRK